MGVATAGFDGGKKPPWPRCGGRASARGSMSTKCPAAKGRGGEGSSASASEPEAVTRRRGDGARGSMMLLADGTSTVTTWMEGN